MCVCFSSCSCVFSGCGNMLFSIIKFKTFTSTPSFCFRCTCSRESIRQRQGPYSHTAGPGRTSARHQQGGVPAAAQRESAHSQACEEAPGPQHRGAVTLAGEQPATRTRDPAAMCPAARVNSQIVMLSPFRSELGQSAKVLAVNGS